METSVFLFSSKYRNDICCWEKIILCKVKSENSFCPQCHSNSDITHVELFIIQILSIKLNKCTFNLLKKKSYIVVLLYKTTFDRNIMFSVNLGVTNITNRFSFKLQAHGKLTNSLFVGIAFVVQSARGITAHAHPSFPSLPFPLTNSSTVCVSYIFLVVLKCPTSAVQGMVFAGVQ